MQTPSTPNVVSASVKMAMNQSFRAHLTGRDLQRAQERLTAAILRAPSLASAVRLAGLDEQYIDPVLRLVFEFAVHSDRDQIRRAVLSGNGDAARLFRSGVEIGHAQALQLARQISESIAREQLAQKRAPDTDEPMRYARPASKAVLEARVKEVLAEDNRAPARDMAAVAAITKSSTAGEPKPSSVSCRAAVVAFLRDLAPGPVAAGEIERLAVASGLLGKGKPLGQSKIFRTVRKSLGIKTYQKPGERAGGWIWSWPDQTPLTTNVVR
jgi:hypothetical protein